MGVGLSFEIDVVFFEVFSQVVVGELSCCAVFVGAHSGGGSGCLALRHAANGVSC